VGRFGGGGPAPCWGGAKGLGAVGAEIGGVGLDRGSGLCENVLELQGTFESGSIAEGQKAAPRIFSRAGFPAGP